MHPNFILFLAIFFSLSSCTSKDNTSILSDNNEEIEYLESLAIQATKDRRLTTPKNNSAFLFYRKILLLNPNHQGAIEGISNLSEIYLSWAIRSIESLEFLSAKEYVRKAEFLDPDNLNIVSVRKNYYPLNNSREDAICFESVDISTDDYYKKFLIN